MSLRVREYDAECQTTSFRLILLGLMFLAVGLRVIARFVALARRSIMRVSRAQSLLTVPAIRRTMLLD